jgi:hypothetical protein
VGDVDVGVDDEAMLLEPEPHIPDIPDVSNPEVVDIPVGIDICDDVDVPGIAVGSVVAGVASVPVVPDVAMLPVVGAVAGAAVPGAVPPPSKLAVDPNIPDSDIPPVEQPLLVIAPVVGIAIVPVTPPVGAGLTPSELTSVEPSGIPVVPTDPLAPIPSGEVAPSEGTAVSGSSGSSTWANAGPAHNKHQPVARINNGLMKVSPMRAEAPRQLARNPLACSVQGPRCHGEHRCRSVLRRSCLWRACRTSVNPSGVVYAAWDKSAAVVVRLLVERRVQFSVFRAERRKPPLLRKDSRLLAPDRSRDQKVAGLRKRFN